MPTSVTEWGFEAKFIFGHVVTDNANFAWMFGHVVELEHVGALFGKIIVLRGNNFLAVNRGDMSA